MLNFTSRQWGSITSILFNKKISLHKRIGKSMIGWELNLSTAWEAAMLPLDHQCTTSSINRTSKDDMLLKDKGYIVCPPANNID